MDNNTVSTKPVLKKGSLAVIAYGRRYVPCVVTAIRPSEKYERFQRHKTVRVTQACLDLEEGDTLTSEVGNVFPVTAVQPTGAIADYVEVCDQDLPATAS